MKALKDLIKVIHKIKSNSNLNRRDKEMLFLWFLFVLSGILLPMNNMSNAILFINIIVFVSLMFIILLID